MDVATMRATARRLLAEDAEPPTPEEQHTLALTLRGMVILAVPEVLSLASVLPTDDVPASCARVGAGEAWSRLTVEPRPGLPALAAHNRRLARSVVAMCDHYETLGGACR